MHEWSVQQETSNILKRKKGKIVFPDYGSMPGRVENFRNISEFLSVQRAKFVKMSLFFKISLFGFGIFRFFTLTHSHAKHKKKQIWGII